MQKKTPPASHGEELCKTCFALILHNIQPLHYLHGKDFGMLNVLVPVIHANDKCVCSLGQIEQPFLDA